MGEGIERDADLEWLHLARHPNDLCHKALQKLLLSGCWSESERQRAARVGVSAALTADGRSAAVREHRET